MQLHNRAEQGESLILGKGDVGVVVQAKDLRHVVEWEALDVGEVALGGRKIQLKLLPGFTPSLWAALQLSTSLRPSPWL